MEDHTYFNIKFPLVPFQEWIYQTPTKTKNRRRPCTPDTKTIPRTHKIVYELVENPAPGVYIVQGNGGQRIKIGVNPEPSPPPSPKTQNTEERRTILRIKYHAKEEEWSIAQTLLSLKQSIPNYQSNYLNKPCRNLQQSATPKYRGFMTKAVRRLADLFNDAPDLETVPQCRRKINFQEEPDEILLDARYDDVTDSEASEWDTESDSGSVTCNEGDLTDDLCEDGDLGDCLNEFDYEDVNDDDEHDRKTSGLKKVCEEKKYLENETIFGKSTNRLYKENLTRNIIDILNNM